MIWHYTIGPKMNEILASHRLQTSGKAGLPPVVWFSSNQVWEPTACTNLALVDPKTNKFMGWPSKEQLSHLVGLGRIGVDEETVPDNWEAFLKKGTVNEEAANHLRATGKELGASVEDWYVSFAPVTWTLWRSVQGWKNGQWINLATWDGEKWH